MTVVLLSMSRCRSLCSRRLCWGTCHRKHKVWKHNSCCQRCTYTLQQPFNCRGQCYDALSNMNGYKKAFTRQILEESSLTLTYCHGHALNLAVGDMIRAERLSRDTIGTTSELSKLIKKSPKREAMLSKMKELSLGTLDLKCYTLPDEQCE